MKESPISAEDSRIDAIYKSVRNNSRMLLYTNVMGRPDDDNKQEQISRDDMWAISTEELNSFVELAQKKYQEGVKSVKGTFKQAYQEGELNGRRIQAEASKDKWHNRESDVQYAMFLDGQVGAWQWEQSQLEKEEQ